MLWLYISGDTPWAVLSKASEKRFPDELLTEEDSCADTEGLVSNIKNMAKKKRGGEVQIMFGLLRKDSINI